MTNGFPIFLKGDDSLVLDTIKRGEDDEDIISDELPATKGRSVIIRIYEALGGRSRGFVVTKLPVSKVYKTNLLEDNEEEVAFNNGQFKIDLAPFQVATYRLCLV